VGIIKSGFHGGSYKRPKPNVVHSVILDVYPEESKAIRQGRRGCSCDGHQLARLGLKCVATARECGAASWSLFPLPGTYIGVPKILVEFHNWGEMGMCNFVQPIARKRYWWDVRPPPQWMTGDERGEKDKDGYFDKDA
jgi:hypothetical protein